MSNTCRKERWSKKADTLYLEVGPVEVNVTAYGTEYNVEFYQDWEKTTNNYSGNRIESGGCVTTWTESANNRLTEWRYSDSNAGLGIQIESLLAQLAVKRNLLISSNKTSPFDQESKINSKSKYGTSYRTLPISVWCTVSDYVEYSFRGSEAEIVKTPEYPEPKEEWEKASPREGTTGHLGNKDNIRVSGGRGCVADSNGGYTRGARIRTKAKASTPEQEKDVTMFLSLKLRYSKITAK